MIANAFALEPPMNTTEPNYAPSGMKACTFKSDWALMDELDFEKIKERGWKVRQPRSNQPLSNNS